MSTNRSRLMGLRDRTEALRGDIPPHRVDGMLNRIDRAIAAEDTRASMSGIDPMFGMVLVLTPDADDFEAEIGWLEEWAAGPEDDS